jgi:branched-chain amino acid transport system substrate-binding protein
MFRKSLVFLVLLTIVVAACGPGGGGASGPIKVGAIFDLTGATSDVGTPYAEGVKAYVDWLNTKGGINGRQIDLISADYGYKVPNAEQLYSQYVTQDKVVAFQGWGTGDTEALRGKIAADKIPFMSASYSANLVSIEDAPYNFLIGTTYSDQMIIAIKWAIDDWAGKGNSGKPKIALLHHDSPFGQSPWPDGEAFAKANGVEITSIPMPGGATDLTPELSQVQSFGANYVIIQNVDGPASLLLKNAKSLGMSDVQFIGLNWCSDELLVDLAGDAAEGFVGTLPFTPPSFEVDGMKDAASYASSKGKSLKEWGVHYIQGWWTMAVMAEGIKRTLDAGQGLTGENIRANLEKIQNFDTGGVTASLSFSPTDHAGNKALRIFHVEGGQWTPISDYISAE